MKKLLLSIVLASLLGCGANAFAYGPVRRDLRHDRRDARSDRRDIRHDRRDIRGDVGTGHYRDARADRRDLRRDYRDIRHDRRDIRRDHYQMRHSFR